MEVHAQLDTRTKLLCGCPVRFGAPPNTLVCPVCLGLPGSLPVPSRAAVEHVLRIALALGCEIPERSWFDRKNYNYPDQPKNYQISQDERPLGRGGALVCMRSGQVVTIDNVHLEEDAGKLLHEGVGPGQSLVDLNRAGTPLAEIVTEPVLHTLEAVDDFMDTLRLLLLHLGASRCRMQEGNLRFEASISLRPRGQTALGTRVEIKNLNSHKAVLGALSHEIVRQAAQLDRGEPIAQQTRLWDEANGRTAPMRSKEQAHDYRYFPEPDIPPLSIPASWRERLAASLPERPRERFERLQRSGLGAYEAEILVSDPALADYHDALARTTGEPRRAALWLINDVLKLLNARKRPFADWNVPPEALAELIALEREGVVSGLVARNDVLPAMWETGERPRTIVEARGLAQRSDDASLAPIVAEVLAAHPDTVAQYRAGKTKVLGFLIGQCMRRSAGRGNPKRFSELLRDALASETDQGSRPAT
ncbi:MAG: Asp-tRNA(Asn)/Glu-tRNA(Gln) amidotransferase subunit GatB [Planctomycetota bacterium]|nr:MAG: Asp-tRNA(Asn)/Glu-tRNA(Gln) amidotransferase subunit GatB [Planctomycetota bacterium]